MGNGMGRLNGAGLNCMTGHKDIVNRGAQSIDNLANQGAQSVNGLTGAVQSLQQLVGTQADSLGQGLHAFLEKQGIILQQGTFRTSALTVFTISRPATVCIAVLSMSESFDVFAACCMCASGQSP